MAHLITVGIPVYNAMPYLAESVQSVLAQTYSDFEVLVINDGSTDDSLPYLQSLRDQRLRILDQKNHGLTRTLNRMLAETRTPWLARHDADDVLYPHRLARTVECITRYPESGMVCSLADYYPRGCYGQFRSTQGNPDQFRDLVASGYLPICCHPTVTLNVERTLAVGGYRFDLLVEDIDLWWRMALKYEIRLIPEVTVGVRQNVESISSANLAKQALHTLYIQYLLISHLWSLEPLPYEQACQHLSRLIDPRKLKSKTHLRGFNIELGRGNRCKALWELGSAILTSPASFLRRLLDELLVHRNICLGERPALFAKNRSALWQSASGQHEGIGNHTTNSNDFPSRSRFAASVSNLPRSPQNSRGSELSPL